VDNIPFPDQWFAISSKDGCLASQHKAILCLCSRYLELSGIQYEFGGEYPMNDCVIWKYQHKSHFSKHCQTARFWRTSDCDNLCCVSHAQLIRAAKACVDVRLDIDHYSVRPDIDHNRAGKRVCKAVTWQARASLDGKQVWSSEEEEPYWPWKTSIMSFVDLDGRDQAPGISKRMLVNVVEKVKENVSIELTDNNWITTQTKVRYHPHHRHCDLASSANACIPGNWKNVIHTHRKMTTKKCAMPGATGGRGQEE